MSFSVQCMHTVHTCGPNVFCGLRTHRLTIFCGWNALFFADTLHVQQLSYKMGMVLPSVRVV